MSSSYTVTKRGYDRHNTIGGFMSITRLMRRTNRFILAATLLLIVGTCPGIASADLSSTANFNIAAQPLNSAIIQYTEQSGVQITSAAELLKGRQSSGVTGTFPASAALTKLLARTGLVYYVVDSNTVVITTPGSAVGQDSRVTQSSSLSRESGRGEDSASGDRLAQVDQGTAAGAVTADQAARDPNENSEKVTLEEVVVTGSRLKRSSNDGAQDVKIYNRTQIEQSGQSTLAGFMNTLPEVSVAIGESAFQVFSGMTTVQLHGLPIGTTLILVNGRRVEETSGAGGFAKVFDLNSIPVSAIERVEVVSEGSSAIYGADAIAGVVNIIMKTNYDGFEATIKQGWASGIDESAGGLSWGHQWSRGSVSVVGSVFKRGELQGSERSITSNQDYRSIGGPDSRFPTCAPGNVFSADGVTPLNGLGSATVAAVPQGFHGTPTIAEFASTAGTLNQCSLFSGYDLIPETRRYGFFASGNFDVSAGVQLFTELMVSRTRQLNDTGPKSLFGQVGFQSFTVSAGNPFNPFRQDVGIGTVLSGLPDGAVDLDTVFYRALIGAKGRLSDSWDWEVAGWRAADSDRYTARNSLDDNSVQAALNSSDPATALNPFVDGPAGSNVLLHSLLGPNIEHNYSADTQSISAFVRGPVIQRAAGPVQIVFGGEYDRGTLHDRNINDPNNGTLGLVQDFFRNKYALFTEARVPLLGSAGMLNSGDRLAVSLAARYDKYDDFGSKTSPQAGIEWRPLRSLLVRGSYSKAYDAPSLTQLHEPVALQTGVITDPLLNDQLEVVTESSGGNKHLKPESGFSRTFGFVYSLDDAPSLRLSVTHWTINENDSVQLLGDQTLIRNSDLFPGRITRAPGQNGQLGPITEIDVSLVNFGRLDVSGFDYQIDSDLDAPIGRLHMILSATETTHFLTALTPRTPSIDAASRAQDSGNWAPRWKAAGALTWTVGPWRATLAGRYVGRYQDYDRAVEIGNFGFLDANVSYSLGHFFAANRKYLRNATFQIGGVNLLNRLPEFSNFDFGVIGYDPTQSDIRGRLIYAQLGVSL